MLAENNSATAKENKMKEQKPFSPSDLFKDGITGYWGFMAQGHSIVIHYKDAEPVKVTLNGIDFVRATDGNSNTAP